MAGADAQADSTSAAGHAADSDAAGDWHVLLLRMAGMVPDDLLSEARMWLAEGLLADVAQAIAFAVSGRIPILAVDVALIAAALSAAGEDTEVLRDLEVVEETLPAPFPWLFSPIRIDDARTAAPGPPSLDVTLVPSADLDAVDRAARAAVDGVSGVNALYRSWRFPADGPSWPSARRVFIVSTAASVPDGDLPTLTAWLQETLSDAGETDPQVEVTREGMAVPRYHSLAWVHSALLWAKEAIVELKLARVFDAADPDLGPSFALDHLILDDPEEIGRMLDYLNSAQPVLITTAVMADIVDPERAQVVPLTFRTDGVWIWTDTISYYLGRYGLAPEEDLLDHLRSVDLPAPVSEVALHRVLAYLQAPGDVESVWVVPTTGESEQSRATV